ncbi:DgyrCDS12028 [Dimorphilus gyrociliatus]|uniref:Annexin n=1 Tax=Dimorphilus gyrociliatus TaxID=2664684 RepID=A0A7I8W5D3_9ANNE|nr:DgyrCDS12028 [Dimorphilus gyrociliatus]
MPKVSGFTFPAGSKLLQKKWEERKQRIHNQKINAMKSGVNNSTPKRYPHLDLRLKKIQIQEEKQAEIDHNNELLLRRLTNIMKHRGLVDNWNEYQQKSLNHGHREKQQERIADENMKIAKYLDSVQPLYNVNNWEQDFHKHEYFLDMWRETTKEYDIFTPRNKRSSSNRYDYESDFEDDTTSRPSRSAVDSKEGGRESQGKKLNKVKTQQKESIVENDTKQLFKACKKLARAEEVIVRCLIRRTHAHRMQIKQKFFEKFDLDLETELKDGTHADLHFMVDCLLSNRDSKDAEILSRAIENNDSATAVEYCCSRPPASIAGTKKALVKINKKPLEDLIDEHIKDEDSRSFLKALFQTEKYEEIDKTQANNDALELFEGDERRFTTGGIFHKKVSVSCLHQLSYIITLYRNVSGGEDLTETMAKDACSQDYIKTVKVLVSCLSSSEKYFAESLHKMLKPNNPELVHLLLIRSEIDTPSIRKAYRKIYGQDLIESILKKCGDKAGPLIAQIAAKVPQLPQKYPPSKPQKDKSPGRRVNGVPIPPPPRKAPLKRPDVSKGSTEDNLENNPLRKKGPMISPRRDVASPTKQGSVTPRKKDSKSPNKEIDRIQDAIKGWGTNEDDLIEIFARRNNKQRQELKKQYSEKYKKDLSDVLKSELSGDFEELILALLMTPSEYDAYCLNKAVKGLGTDENVLITILSTRNSKEIRAISSDYNKIYKSDLSEDIADDTSGGFKTLLNTLLVYDGPKDGEIDINEAKANAEMLIEAGLSDASLIEALAKNSKNQAKEIINQYKILASNDLLDDIKTNQEGDDELSFCILVRAIQDPVLLFTQKIRKSLTTNDDDMLIRLIVSRQEIDLPEIKKCYQKTYSETLETTIDKECKKDFKNMLLAIIK